MISAYVRDTQRYVDNRHYWLVGVSPEAAYEALALIDSQSDVEVCVYVSGAIPDDIKLRLYDLLKENDNKDIVPYLQGNRLRMALDAPEGD